MFASRYLRLVGLLAISLANLLSLEETHAKDGEWITIFNGKDLDGWKSLEHSETFQVRDGELVVKGDRGHLFYIGPVADHDFTNFEWKCEILTKPGANSGMFFHTKEQPEGWLNTGYEAQIDNSHTDPRRTGGIYSFADVMDKSPAKDNQWFTQQVTVQGKRVVIRVNDKITTDFTEPEKLQRPKGQVGKRLSHGTLAIQGHDPESEVHFRNIQVRVLSND